MMKRPLSVMLVFGVLLASGASAQAPERRGPQIVTPADGTTVSGPVTVTVGFGARPDGQGGPGGGGGGGDGGGGGGRGPRFVLFVDAPAPQPGSAVTTDAAHVAFPDGERAVTVTLKPGPHSLQLVLLNREGNVNERIPLTPPTKIVVK